MKETAKVTGRRRYCRDVCSLGAVAKNAGGCEVLSGRQPSVLFSDNVLYLASIKHIVFVQQAILAQTL
jgi:hypothetical protein